MIDKIIFMNEKPKNNNLIYIFIIVIIIILIYLSYRIKTYDIYKTTALISNKDNKSYINITLNYENIDILEENPIIEYLDKTYNINNIIYEEPYLNNNVAYQDIIIETDLKDDNRIINISILYNKQRIKDKIKKY